jgi:acyl-CoA thioesterase FadM
MNYEIISVLDEVSGVEQQHVIIDNGDGSFTSMPKAVWDELEAAKENGTIS